MTTTPDLLEPGALRIWWTPQIPMKAFEIDVPDLVTAGILLDTLGAYDAFQFENKVKGDYCNAGGLMILREDGEWEDWEDPETFDDFDTYRLRAIKQEAGGGR